MQLNLNNHPRIPFFYLTIILLYKVLKFKILITIKLIKFFFIGKLYICLRMALGYFILPIFTPLNTEPPDARGASALIKR